MVLGKKVIYEYHLVMDRFYNIVLEWILSKCSNVRHVFITQSLKDKYIETNKNLKKSDCLVLSDCANDPQIRMEEYHKEHLSCGYIGSFLPGKGIEVVVELAKRFPNNEFHIIGGTNKQIQELKKMLQQILYGMDIKNKRMLWNCFIKRSMSHFYQIRVKL